MLKIRPTKTPASHWYSGLIALFIALASLFIMIDSAVEENAFRQSASRSDGMVTTQFSKHHVLIKFSSKDGKSIEFVQNGFVSFEVGDHVTVLYDPAAPQQSAKADSFGALWGDAIDSSFFFVFFLLASFLMIFFPEYIEIRGFSNKS